MSINSRFISFFLIALFSVALPACARSSGPGQLPSSASPWEGRLKSLFDDSIDPSAIGLAGTTATTSGGVLQARAEEAHHIVRVRVTTVSTEGSNRTLRYLITLRVTGDPIAGPRPPSDTIQIVIGQDNPTFALAKTQDIRLTGTSFIAFLREFDQDGSPVVHWHLARDGEDVVKAARDAAVLSELKKD